MNVLLDYICTYFFLTVALGKAFLASERPSTKDLQKNADKKACCINNENTIRHIV